MAIRMQVRMKQANVLWMLSNLLLLYSAAEGRGHTQDEIKERIQAAVDRVELVNVSSIEPPAPKNLYFLEDFQGKKDNRDRMEEGRIVKSKVDKYKNQRVEIRQVPKNPGSVEDYALEATLPGRNYGLTMLFDDQIEPGNESFVVQYEVRLLDSLECGGAYIKLVSAYSNQSSNEKFDPENLSNETPYAIMFGPDRCGQMDRVHFIIRHENPVSGVWAEHHMTNPPSSVKDRYSHLYTLVINPENSFKVLIDGEVKRSGSLLDDMDPPINPPKMIPDPDAVKPFDWVDDAKMPDPEATKPADWDEDAPQYIEDLDATKPPGWLDDEPLRIPDPNAKRPGRTEEWDDEEDGEWEPPHVDNPKCEDAPGCGDWKSPLKKNPNYKGQWSPPLIDNPDYKGPWEPPLIENPHFFVDMHPHLLHPMAGIAIEIWTMSGSMYFDNFLVCRDEDEALRFGLATTVKKKETQLQVESVRDLEDRRIRREDDLDEGGVVAIYNYAMGEALDFMVIHPNIAIFTLVVLVVMFVVYFTVQFYKISQSADEIDEEELSEDEDQHDDTDKRSEEQENEQEQPEESGGVREDDTTAEELLQDDTTAEELLQSENLDSRQTEQTTSIRKRATTGKKD